MVVPRVVPFTATLTPGKPVLSSLESTRPVTVRSCAGFSVIGRAGEGVLKAGCASSVKAVRPSNESHGLLRLSDGKKR